MELFDKRLKEEAGKFFDASGGVYHFDGMRFSVPYDLTDRKFRARFVVGGYETEEEYHFVKTYVAPDSTVLELGGCLGVMSCYVNRLLSTPTRHVVIEANPLLIPYLEQNRDANGCKFTVVHGMLSLQEQEKFYVHNLIVGGSNKRVTDKCITVPGIHADMLMAQWGIFDTLIVDIEGGELSLLREQPELFRKCSTLLIEVHPFKDILTYAEACEVENLLHQAGLKKITCNHDNHYQVWQR
jgi:FkbM family methyltransferase